jgi:hypothetical protein
MAYMTVLARGAVSFPPAPEIGPEYPLKRVREKDLPQAYGMECLSYGKREV